MLYCIVLLRIYTNYNPNQKSTPNTSVLRWIMLSGISMLSPHYVPSRAAPCRPVLRPVLNRGKLTRLASSINLTGTRASAQDHLL